MPHPRSFAVLSVDPALAQVDDARVVELRPEPVGGALFAALAGGDGSWPFRRGTDPREGRPAAARTGPHDPGAP